MEQETDYLLREVKRLTIFLTNLIGKLSSLNNDEVEVGIKETDDFIKKEWGLTFNEVITFDKTQFIEKLENLPEVHLEKFAELLSVIAKRINTSKLECGYDTKEIAKKGLILIDKIDKTSNIFSMERMRIKNDLQRFVR